MRLLNRTVRSYLIYSILLVLICTPLFYFSIRQLFTREMDRILFAHKQDFIACIPYLQTEPNRNFFQLINKEFILTPVNKTGLPDQFIYLDAPDQKTKQIITYRALITEVKINGQNYQLIIQESTVRNSTLITAIVGVQVLLLIALSAGLLLINQKLSRSIWSPFYIILDRLKKYKIDQDVIPQLPELPVSEFRELSAVITQLINKSHEAYLNQKEFTENASHEIQTPLAICRTKLELLAQTKELTREQAELVGSLLDATDRISRLNKNLLLLSKIENRQFLEMENIHLKSVVTKIANNYATQAEDKHLTMQLLFHSDPIIKGNPVLVDALVHNLLSNAIRHTTEYGHVLIECAQGRVIFRNSGTPLESPEKLFNRFHRESRSTPGSGLGLSIAKKITDVSGYQLTYNYLNGEHSFCIAF